MGPEIVLISQTVLAFHIPLLRLGRGENDREPLSARRKRVEYERGRVAWAWERLALQDQLRVPAGPPWDVCLTRGTPAGVGLDDDNLVASFKAVRDQIADQLRVNDGDARIIQFSCFQEKLAKEWGVRIEIRSRPPEIRRASCRHLSQLYRSTYGYVGEFHVVDRCRKCGTRLRDGWVPHSEAKEPLQEDPWARGNDPRQGRLL